MKVLGVLVLLLVVVSHILVLRYRRRDPAACRPRMPHQRHAEDDDAVNSIA